MVFTARTTRMKNARGMSLLVGADTLEVPAKPIAAAPAQSPTQRSSLVNLISDLPKHLLMQRLARRVIIHL